MDRETVRRRAMERETVRRRAMEREAVGREKSRISESPRQRIEQCRNLSKTEHR